MVSDFSRIRFVLPLEGHAYNVVMKTLTTSLVHADESVHQFRLHVLQHGKKHGVNAATEAFGISRRTYFVWQKRLKDHQGKLVSLVPRSTRPKRVRSMVVDERLLEFIKQVRQEYGRIGKKKLTILVGAYAHSLGIPPYQATKIGKIIQRNHYFFEHKKKRKITLTARQRMKRSPKGMRAGYVEMDSVHVWVANKKLVFITVIDVVTRVAYAERVKSASSLDAKIVFEHFQTTYATRVHSVQTDNGSEFLGAFHAFLEAEKITHLFSYPRSPKVNGYIERFNRTLQEEFIDRCDAWWYDLPKGDLKLTKYLTWYNAQRPHASLGYLTPLAFVQSTT